MDAVLFHDVTLDRPADVERLSALATAIVKDWYDPIIGPDQNDYMIARFQSVPALLEQLRGGCTYQILQSPGEPRTDIGFVGFYPRGNELYLSKFYLAAPWRGKGLAKPVLRHVAAFAAARGLGAITLNVNRHNPTLAVYEALGFRRIREECNPIGHGFFMDDYVCSIPVPLPF